MRIISGNHRGKRLISPQGSSTRPTAEHIRETLFNILQHGLSIASVSGIATETWVLDVFAGTGALGFEALSRGAYHVVFIETDIAACRVIQKNAFSLGVADRTTLLRRNAVRLSKPPNYLKPSELIFLDPPYGKGLASRALNQLIAHKWLGKHATVVIEMAFDDKLAVPNGFTQADERRYGNTKIVFLRRQELP